MPKTRSFTTFCDLIFLHRLKTVAGTAALIFGIWTSVNVLLIHPRFWRLSSVVAFLSTMGAVFVFFSAGASKIGARSLGAASLFIITAGFVNLHLHTLNTLELDNSEITALFMVCASPFVLTRFRFLFTLCIATIPSVSILLIYQDRQLAEHLLYIVSSLAVSFFLNKVMREVLGSQFENRRILRGALHSATRQGNRIRHLAELSFEAIIEHEGGVLKAANRQFSELVGKEENALIGRCVCDFFLPGDYRRSWDLLREEYERAVAAGHPPDCSAVSSGLIKNVREEVIPVKVIAGDLKGENAAEEVMVFRDLRPSLRGDQFEEFVTRSAVRFINVPLRQINTAIQELLGTAGSYSGADRAYLFWLDDGGETISNTHEWCAPGIDAQKASLQHVPVSELKWWFDRMYEDREIAIPDVASLPDSARSIKEILQAQGIQSLLAIGLFEADMLTGFVGFDAVGGTKSFPQSDASILRLVAEIALNVMLRAKTEKRLNEQDAIFQQLTDNIRDVFYIMSPTMSQVYYLSPAFDAVWGFSRFSVYEDPSLLIGSMLQEDREIIASRNRRRSADPGAVNEATEFRIRRADGSIAWIRIKSSLIEGSRGTVERIAGVAVDVTEDHERRVEKAAQIDYEKKLAARIQRTLLFGHPPQSVDGLKISTASAAAQTIAGDFFEFFVGKEYLDVFVGDVMGKGVPAALTSAGIKNTVFRIMGEIGRASSGERSSLPVEIIERASLHLNPDLVKLESFATLSFTRVDLRTGILSFVDCGHVPLIRLDTEDGRVDFIKGDDVPLGWDRPGPFHEHWVPVKTGDLLLFYSDGITEAASPDDELYGEHRLGGLLRQLGKEDPSSIALRIKDDVLSFVGPQAIRDDITCITVLITENIPAPEHSARAEFPANFEELPAIRRWVESSLANFDVDRGSQLKVALSVHEAVANDIEHGVPVKENDRIALDIRRIGGTLFVMIQDEREFFQDFYFGTQLERREDRGFGLQIIREVFHSLTYYTSSNGSNTLVLALNLGEEADA